MANNNNISVEMNIYQKLQKVRCELNDSPLKKSGYNKHLNFNYFELGDFIPTATKLFDKYELCPIFSIGYDANGIEMATLKVVSGPEVVGVSFPTDVPTNMTGIQGQGAKITYMERYCYRSLLCLTENDQVDASLDNDNRNAKVEDKKATPKQVEMIRQLYDEENIAKMLEYYNINSLEELSIKTASEVIARKRK